MTQPVTCSSMSTTLQGGQHSLFAPVLLREHKSERRILRVSLAALAGTILLVVAVTMLSREAQPGHTAAETELAFKTLHPLTHRDFHRGDQVTPPDSHSIPPTGIFTGHSHGEKGGPLSFGPGTFSNFLGSADDDCDEGTAGSAANKCEPCPANHFCPGGLFTYSCPDHTKSNPGSKSMDDCECLPGFFGNGKKAYCHQCPVGHFCLGGGNPSVAEQCPDASTTLLVQQESKESCLCVAGFQPKEAAGDQWDCKPCEEGSFCPAIGSGATKCPDNTISEEGSISKNSCICKEGFQRKSVDGDQWDCKPCEAGFYCPEPGVGAKECPEGSQSEEGSDSVDQCICIAGYQPKDPSNPLSGCKLCEEGFYCPEAGAGASECPFGSTSVEGATNQAQCQCIKGYQAKDPNGDLSDCEMCKPGFYCPDTGVEAKECPAGSSSPDGSTSKDSCVCAAGFQQKDPLGVSWDCVRCKSGFYCPTEGAGATECPFGASSGPGADSEDLCQCLPGFQVVDPAGAQWDCEQCPAGFYCPISGEGGTQCPAKSTSPQGSTTFEACVCLEGNYMAGVKGAEECTACPANFFCNQNLKKPCPSGTESPAESGDESACVQPPAAPDAAA